jgi:DNA polymerase elongation subunit (family B)
MTRDEKINKIEELKNKATQLKREVDYYNAMQTALKLVLNGSYGAFATPYFVLFNNNVASTITAQGRDLTKTMDKVNEDYWYKQWHLDYELHRRLCVTNVTQIPIDEHVSIYADTDSLFVSFLPAINHSNWKDLIFNKKRIESIKKPFIVLAKEICQFENENCLGKAETVEELKELLTTEYQEVLIDGRFILDRELKKLLTSGVFTCEPRWNWARELDYIHGIDQMRYGDYFKKCLEEYASGFGVENKEDFELERVSESIISLAKKKYIQHVAFEDGIPYERLTYLFPKGVELVRRSTPAFARDKIINIVKYLFENSDTFNIKDLLKLVKQLRKEFELADIDDISMQSSCSKYDQKVIDDKTLPLKFVNGAHFAVKASAYHNYLISQDKEIQRKYEPIKSGTKIKYYYCKNRSNGDMFAYIRGQYPIEVAPEIDFDTQFEKSILSPINTIIEPLGMPEITARLSVVMDIFSGFGFGK